MCAHANWHPTRLTVTCILGKRVFRNSVYLPLYLDRAVVADVMDIPCVCATIPSLATVNLVQKKGTRQGNNNTLGTQLHEGSRCKLCAAHSSRVSQLLR